MNNRPITLGIIAILTLLLSGCVAYHPVAQRRDIPDSVPQYDNDDSYYFDNDLAPWGKWIVHVDYGRVWRPHGVSIDWRPYTHGYWAIDNDDWYWNSDYAWGNTVFHYGRWTHDQRHGWVWVAGRKWAPSWVSWRHDNNWVGWAPLPPERHSGHGSPHRPNHRDYNFVRQEDFSKREIARHIYSRDRNQSIFAATREATRYPVKPQHDRVNPTGKPVIPPRGHSPGKPQDNARDKGTPYGGKRPPGESGRTTRPDKPYYPAESGRTTRPDKPYSPAEPGRTTRPDKPYSPAAPERKTRPEKPYYPDESDRTTRPENPRFSAKPHSEPASKPVIEKPTVPDKKFYGKRPAAYQRNPSTGTPSTARMPVTPVAPGVQTDRPDKQISPAKSRQPASASAPQKQAETSSPSSGRSRTSKESYIKSSEEESDEGDTTTWQRTQKR